MFKRKVVSAFEIYLDFVNWEQVGRKVCFLLQFNKLFSVEAL